MLRLILLTLLFALLVMTASWLSAHPGEVSITWLGWRIDTSASFLLFGIAVVAVLTAMLIFLLRTPWRWKSLRQEQRYVHGLRALTQSLVALSGGDMRDAKAELRQAQKFLGPAPITLLLAAQMSRLEGDDAQTRGLLEAMLGHRETRRIAARDLSEYHTRRGQAAMALPHAKLVAHDDPRDSKALSTLIGAQAKLGKWQEAEAALKRVAWIVPRAERRRLKALVYCAQAGELKAAGQDGQAYTLMRHALKAMPDSPPLAALAADMATGDNRAAIVQKTIKAAWKRQPHAVLADALMASLASARHADLLKAARKVANTHPGHEESHLLMARAAMQANAWDDARRALKEALSERESARACRMMAELEEAQYRDAEASARWRLRAANAEADPQWTCNACGTVSTAWKPHCPACHALGSLEWKRQSLRYAA